MRSYRDNGGYDEDRFDAFVVLERGERNGGDSMEDRYSQYKR